MKASMWRSVKKKALKPQFYLDANEARDGEEKTAQ